MGSDVPYITNGRAFSISIHAPRMGSDDGFARDDSQASISIHAPRMGSDARAAIWLPTSTNFNPRSPHGERRCPATSPPSTVYFNPRSPHGERRRRAGLQPHRVRISIHAPRMGSDDAAPAAPEKPAKFQSTLPAWGATRWKMRRCASCWHFNPRSPHGERRGSANAGKVAVLISIHAPRMGSDGNSYTQVIRSGRFQSTLPAWGATIEKAQGTLIVFISIHAPRMGSDPSEMFAIAFSRYFNPRSPHGERPEGLYSSPFFQHFNPRSPHGERHQADGISASVVGDFNPRSPHGERPAGATGTVYDPEFQSTLPAWGATFTPCPSVDAPKPFQSTLPAWGATSCCMRICAM